MRVVFVAVNEMVATHFTVELVDNCGGSVGGTRGTRRSPVQIPPGARAPISNEELKLVCC